MCLIADLVEADPLPANPYTELRRRLLAAHQLTDIQRVEQLFNLPPLGAQKPSELLAEMLRLCPRGQENNAFFNCLFLNKLPRELRILLSEADMADKQALGARADLFAAHNSKQAHDVVAADFGFSDFGSRRRGDHSGCGPPRSRQRAARRRRRTAGRRLEGQEEAGPWRRCRRQRTAGVPHADPRGAGQGRQRPVL